MEENILAGRGIVFNRTLEAVSYQGSGDKITLPPSCFTELSDQGAFDKEEGYVGLPPHIWNNLYSLEASYIPLIEVRYVWLPKGTYAKLQADELGFSDIPNHKSVLETSPATSTLSQEDVLTVSHGTLTYHLRVLELILSSSVSVLETDIEVDIVGPDLAPDRTNQHVLRPLMFGKTESGVIEEGNYMYYKFSIDNDTWGKITSGDADIEVKVEPEALDGDTDLYISRHPFLFPTRHQHVWSSHDVGSKSLALSSKDQSLGAGTYSIGLYGFKGTTQYQLLVSIQDIAADARTDYEGYRSMRVFAGPELPLVILAVVRLC